jgi:hypothetical protein
LITKIVVSINDEKLLRDLEVPPLLPGYPQRPLTALIRDVTDIDLCDE